MLTVTDLFAGAGGSSLGAEMAGDVELALAVNHWEPAINTLRANHDKAVIEQSDLRMTDPANFFKTDILLASPSCVGNSRARNANVRPADPTQWRPDVRGDRARATMWDVLEWVDLYSYDAIVLENVTEWRSGTGFRSFLAALRELGPQHGGYSYEMVYANSSFHGVPQSRDRLYLVGWKNSLRRPDLNFAPKAHCDRCNEQVDTRQVFKSNFDTKWRRHLQRWVDGQVQRPTMQWGTYGPTGQWYWACEQCRCEVAPPTPTIADTLPDVLDAPTLGQRAEAGRPVKTVLGDILTRELVGKTVRGEFVEGRFAQRPGRYAVVNNSGGRLKPVEQEPYGAFTAAVSTGIIEVPEGHDAARDGFDDIRYRRVPVESVKVGCGFPGDYELVGNREDQYRMLGNAVTPPVMRDLVSRVYDMLDSDAAPATLLDLAAA